MISYWGVDHNDEVSKALMPMSVPKVKAMGRLTRMKVKAMPKPSGRTMGIAAGGAAAGGVGGYAMGRKKEY